MTAIEKPGGDALAGSAIHVQWVSTYRTPEAQAFYEMAFDEIVRRLSPPPDSIVLDAGCGSCAKSVLLAARGFRVVGADFSETALRLAVDTVRQHGVHDRIDLHREDLLDLSFADGAFPYVVCWGVLMHVPDLQRALAELARVLAPGGCLVLSEGNMHSAQSVALGLLKRVLRRGRGRVARVPAGLEATEETSEGVLLTRQTDFAWLRAECQALGLQVRARLPGQFTELYALVRSSRVKRLIHLFNRWWFLHVRWAAPAFGNIVILEKRAAFPGRRTEPRSAR